VSGGAAERPLRFVTCLSPSLPRGFLAAAALQAVDRDPIAGRVFAPIGFERFVVASEEGYEAERRELEACRPVS
jgi:hypothetical protein